MSTSPSFSRQAGQLSDVLQGEVVLPRQRGFEEARQAFNRAADQEPAAVVFAESTQDVVAAVTLAAEHGRRVAPQSTGHSAMPLESLTNTILLKTERMRGVQIDPAARTARIEAGAVWGDIVEAAARHGLAGLPGSSGNVGAVGYTLGGGVSFFGRKYGLSANNVRAVEVVTADGQLRHADSQHEPDLFWALRGGGGSFGVVTAMELELFPVAQVYAGILWYPIERATEVLRTWRDLTRGDMPDELTTVGRFFRAPQVPELPAEIRGKSFALVEAYHLGDPAQADALLAPLRALGPGNDTIRTVAVPELLSLHMDPEQPTALLADGLMIAGLPDEAIDALVQIAGANAAFPLASVEVRHLGGELGRHGSQGGALPSLDAQYLLAAESMTPTAELLAASRAQIEAVQDALTPWAAPHMYLDAAETPHPRAPLWTSDAYRRLRQIKASVDPHDVIQSNHPVPPAQ
jgi:UDP-N-acetylenolpyruvoylglucosamine reductase